MVRLQVSCQLCWKSWNQLFHQVATLDWQQKRKDKIAQDCEFINTKPIPTSEFLAFCQDFPPHLLFISSRLKLLYNHLGKWEHVSIHTTATDFTKSCQVKSSHACSTSTAINLDPKSLTTLQIFRLYHQPCRAFNINHPTTITITNNPPTITIRGRGLQVICTGRIA